MQQHFQDPLLNVEEKLKYGFQPILHLSEKKARLFSSLMSDGNEPVLDARWQANNYFCSSNEICTLNFIFKMSLTYQPRLKHLSTKHI